MSERYELYYDPGALMDVPENEGLYEAGVEPMLHRIREAGATYAVVDVSGFSRQQLEDAYVSRAVPPSVRRQYGVKRVFGTNKYAGSRFGRGVPALVVLEDGRPVDVYPHEKEGRIVTIHDYVKHLAGEAGHARGAELARRMDAVRAKFTGVRMTAGELVKEGRRR